jgi:DNA helicase-2/ATP-dependent DNA helicase PcrA
LILDWLDSSLNYINILTNAKFMEMTSEEVENLKQTRNKPYFTRIDFQREGFKHKDEFYLDKTSLYDKNSQLPIIVDWRSPVANVYYDGRLGDVEYETED